MKEESDKVGLDIIYSWNMNGRKTVLKYSRECLTWILKINATIINYGREVMRNESMYLIICFVLSVLKWHYTMRLPFKHECRYERKNRKNGP